MEAKTKHTSLSQPLGKSINRNVLYQLSFYLTIYNYKLFFMFLIHDIVL